MSIAKPAAKVRSLSEARVSVVGGANIDWVGTPLGPLLQGESNPGQVRWSSGGVGRNIAENLVRLGVATRLLTAIGRDSHGDKIHADCVAVGIDMRHTLVLEGNTATYLAILDDAGDMHLALSDMKLLDAINAEFIAERDEVLARSEVVVIDANLPPSTLAQLLDGRLVQPVFVDTVSAAKAPRFVDLLHHVHTLKPNRAEAEVLTGLSITDTSDLRRALQRLLELGVRQVFISLGGEGMFYGDATVEGRLPAPRVQRVNATGAGDAAMAALVYAELHGWPLEDSARLALAASALVLSHPDSTHPEMAIDRLRGQTAGSSC